MLNIANLASSINGMLDLMDANLTKAKSCMGIKPDLAAAKVYTEAAATAIEGLSKVILEARAEGVLTPPDVIGRINTRTLEVNSLVKEIMTCALVQVAGDARGKSPATGKNAAN